MCVCYGRASQIGRNDTNKSIILPYFFHYTRCIIYSVYSYFVIVIFVLSRWSLEKKSEGEKEREKFYNGKIKKLYFLVDYYLYTSWPQIIRFEMATVWKAAENSAYAIND